MRRVFVSYSRRNKNFAERLARDLSDAGLDVWVDWRQIQAGELWQNEIYRGIERSEMLIFCLSPDAVTSEWCQREINTARQQGKIIIPVMAVSAMTQLQQTESMRWLLDVHFINFENRYEEAFPELLNALPGLRRVGAYDDVDPAKIPNPFKGLEAFQQTDSHFFFGREELIRKALNVLSQEHAARFLAVVGASGSGKSSLVRAGIIPEIRSGTLPDSDEWPVVIFAPGSSPVDALAQRLAPLREDMEGSQIERLLTASPQNLDRLVEGILSNDPKTARLLLVVDQFEEVFTRANEAEGAAFLAMLHYAVTRPGGRTQAIITMRADFFDRLGRYPDLARLFEQENLLIVTEMTAADLLHAIEGPAEAVGLSYEEGLPQRILDDVRRQPGSLPLLQYALKELYALRDGRRLSNAAYEKIGGVRRALATHAENIYLGLNAAQQALMRRMLLRLVEVGATGEATRRRVDRNDLAFRDVPDQAVQEVIDLLTAPTSRLLIASREIKASEDDQTAPTVWIEVGHEALIREWKRFTDWVAENVEGLRFGGELLQSANNWQLTNRDMAYLLTGNRLARAEDWLDSGDPTVLQREFIQLSLEEEEKRAQAQQEQLKRELSLEAQAANRLRLVAVVLVVGIIIAAALSVFALLSLREARAQENRAEAALQTAEESARQAQSLALSASANRELVDSDTDLAVMLAVQANQINSPPPQSQRTLAEVAYAPGTRRVLSSSGGIVNAVDYSPNGSTALMTDENAIILWDVNTGREIRRFEGHTRPINSVKFSPDGRTFASAADDGVIILWDVETGAEVRRFVGHRAGVNSLAFNKDGLFLVSGGADWAVIMWQVETGEVFRRFEGHTDAVNSAVFNTNASQIVSTSDDDTVRLWNVFDSVEVRQFPHDSDVNTVVFSPIKANILTGSEDGTVRLFNANTGDEISRFDEHEGQSVNAVIFNTDGSQALSAANDNTIIIYDTATAQRIGEFNGHSGPVLDLAYGLNGRRLLSASADGTMRVWDTKRAEEIIEFRGHEVRSIRSSFAVGVFSPDGRTILSGAADNTLRFWNVNTGLTIQQFLGHTGRVNDVAISADGLRALSGSSDDSLILWDIASGQPIRTIAGGHGDVLTVAFMPDNTQAVASFNDGTLVLWNLGTGEAIRVYDLGNAIAVLDAAVSPDGQTIVSASSDQLVLWNVATGDILRQFSDQGSVIQTVAFNPSGTQIAAGAGNGGIVLWDAATGTIAQTFEGHDRAVLGIDFSPDGESFISGSQDSTLRLWDVSTGFELRRYEADESIRSVDFRADGREVVTGLSDSTLSTWRVFTNLRDLMDWTFANRFINPPTCEDRRTYQILPYCDDAGIVPAATPYPLPVETVMPETTSRLTIGSTAVVNTDNNDNLLVRVNPGRNEDVVVRLQDNNQVTLLDGPVFADEFIWWRIRTAEGLEGWAAESVPADGIQTLVPQ